MWIVAGLGNPGAKYADNRHNIGFMVVDRLARGRKFSKKFDALVTEVTLNGERVLLLKPQTFMNHSGRAVQAALAFYKLPPEQLIVVHDDLDLPLGKLRIKKGGGAGGHNGIKDIDACIGPDYWRMRLGIAHPGSKEEVHHHVLGDFSKEDRVTADKVVQTLAEQFALFWQHSPEALMSKVAEEVPGSRLQIPETQTTGTRNLKPGT